MLVLKAQVILGHPPDAKFNRLVSSKSVKHYKVKVNDGNNAHAIFTPDLGGLWGQKTR